MTKKHASDDSLPAILCCPLCGQNVIGHARAHEYIDGRPAVLCRCGAWVARKLEYDGPMTAERPEVGDVLHGVTIQNVRAR
jgi:hypothetical protein